MPHDNTFHKRADASCRTIDIEHMKRCMDGDAYASLEAFAKNNWGADWTQIIENPPDQPNFGLSGCVVAPVPTVTFDDHPPCVSQVANSSVIATQDGNVKIPYDTGISSFTSATVVQAAVMPIQTTVEGDISIPALGDGFDPFSISLTLNNFLLSNDSSRKADTSPTSVEARATKGQQCYAPLNNVTCTAEGYTRFQIASSGYIWFTYNTSRGTPPNTQWAVSIEQVIPDASLRSTYMKVNATTVATRLVAAGDPVCDSQSRFTGGGQTLLVVDLAFDSGTTSLAQITVTDDAAFPLASSVTADIHWQFDQSQPGLGGNLTMPATIINAAQESAQASHANLTTNRAKATAAPNQSCFQPMTNVSCTATGKGRMQIAYSGNLWFNYPTPRGTPPNVHYKWAPGLDASLDNRSTYISFTATVSTYTLTQDSLGPQCLFADTTGPSPKPPARQNTAKYLAPTLAVIAVVCVGGAYWFCRRRRQRTRRRDPPPPTLQVEASYPSSSEYTAVTTPGGSGQQRRHSAATSAWDATLPAYSEIGRDS